MTLRLTDIGFVYPTGHRALQSVSFEISSGELVLLCGHNGAGKSTLLKLLLGILRPSKGTIELDGTDVRHHTTAELARRIALTFQHPSNQLFAASVREEVEFGPRNLRRPSPEALANMALSSLGLSADAESHPYDLPPARRKLVTLASALAMDCELCAFDEPTAGTSADECNRVVQSITLYQKRGKSFLVVSHDLDTFLPMASRVVVLHHGRVTFTGSPADIQRSATFLRRFNLHLPLTFRIQQLLSAISTS